jgi:SAM-dependent methyltransferase
VEPYLTGGTRARFDAWHQDVERRHAAGLAFAEIRKGVQALSSIYVERRGSLRRPEAALDGAGKRAAFALYFGPLHFLATYHAVREIGFDAVAAGRLWDLGCGTGAAGAAWGAAILEARGGAGTAEEAAGAPTVVGLDRSGFALDEAAVTYAAFGLPARILRRDLARGGLRAAPRPLPGAGDALLAAFSVNELEEEGREALLAALLGQLRKGGCLLLVEPVARRAAPWWGRWAASLGSGALAVHDCEWRRRIERPAWIERMDRACGLDHSELTARVLGILT